MSPDEWTDRVMGLERFAERISRVRGMEVRAVHLTGMSTAAR
jgi:hypothetical protein